MVDSFTLYLLQDFFLLRIRSYVKIKNISIEHASFNTLSIKCPNKVSGLSSFVELSKFSFSVFHSLHSK